MKFGYFDDYQREYVITQPDTPLPWINYLGSEDYFGLISNTAGGYSFYRDARLRRLTRYRYNNVPTDSSGRYLYIRDNLSGEFWSPTWQPVKRTLDTYECRHGAGYTNISSSFDGILSDITYFVPLGQNLEVWQVRIGNSREETADLSLFSLVEFCLWDAMDDATNFQRNLNIAEVEVEEGVIYHKSEYRERRDHFAYFACSLTPVGFDTQREEFLGPYGGWNNPLVVERGKSNGSIAHGWAPIASFSHHLSLMPDEEIQLIFLLGYQENPRDKKFDPPGSSIINKQRVRPVITKYLDSEKVYDAFNDLRRYWDKLFNVFQTNTPNDHVDRMVNIWNAYQNMITFNMSRSASYFESGIGRGMGFRDSNQDLLGFVHMIPERARERILDIAATQLENGGAYHQYQPLTKRGNDSVGGGFNDDPLWLVLSTIAYVKETGDFSILENPVPYENEPGSEAPLYDHLRRSLDHILERLGPHKLPLIGRADWNDCLNLNTFSEEPGESFQTTMSKDGKVAESVFIAGLFVLAAMEMVSLASVMGKTEDEQKYKLAADEMTETVFRSGWDGSWFLRAYDDFGDKVGSSSCDEGRIFIEPQGICVMAGMGLEDGRALQALDSVNKHLATMHGIVLHQPAYTHYYLNLGEISSYPPGYKENAGIFCHTNPWIMIAETQLGRASQAMDYYLRINPSAREVISDVHRSEPYVYAQMIAGIDAPTFGEAKNSWLSGTAAWNYVAITQWILGIRPTLEGLQIAPVVPDNWNGFQVMRLFRGVTYEIDVRRTGPGNEIRLEVSGEPLTGNIIPLPDEDISAVEVKVVLGKTQ
jgi:cellobiose phosphorylase